MSDPMSEFLQLFREEAGERLDSMETTLLGLERGSDMTDAVETLFRDAHTIKGGAGMLGLKEIRAFAHALEDVLGGAREAGELPRELVDPLLRATDALRKLVRGDADPNADLLAELAERRAQLVAEPGSEPEPPATGASEPAPSRAPSSLKPGQPVASERAQPAGSRSVRVAAEKLDHLLDLVGEAMLHRRRLEHVLAEGAGVRTRALVDELDQGERLLDDLKGTAIQMRTLPLASITGTFPRAVRDIAAEQGKEVDLLISGAETELDRVILERLSDPLVHLLRNAVGHGVEPPEERERVGKSRRGAVELRAEQRGRQVLVTVSDDGHGVPAELLEQAQASGASLADFLARPGFSTAGEVTDLSGRGVGMGAVQTQVESLGGSVDVASEPGRGTTVTLLLPLTLALLDVLLVERAGQPFAIPLASVEEGITVSDPLSLEGRAVLDLRGKPIPLVDLADVIGLAGPVCEPRAPAVVLSVGLRRVALACDRLIGQEEIVVKSLGGLLSWLGGYLGAAILGDGKIALILDPVELVNSDASARDARTEGPAPAKERLARKVLVVEDSFTVRELQRNILEAAGYLVVTAKHGKEALELIADDDDLDLVVTDIEMPEMDGIALTEAIRAHPARSSLPVIVVTTRESEEDRRRGRDAGADAYMVKRSFDQQILLDTVRQLVGR